MGCSEVSWSSHALRLHYGKAGRTALASHASLHLVTDACPLVELTIALEEGVTEVIKGGGLRGVVFV